MHKLKNVLIDNHKKMAVIILGWGSGAMASTFPTYS
jgi:CRISPR/Cas system CSM-associated protein Csm5 (group 7 of RAMP superfamily)